MQSALIQSGSAGVPVLAANGTIINLLAGQPIEIYSEAATVTLYGNADAVGVTMSMAFASGAAVETVISPGSVVSVASTVGKVKINEDFLGQFAIAAGKRIILGLVNTTAAAIVARMQLVVT